MGNVAVDAFAVRPGEALYLPPPTGCGSG